MAASRRCIALLCTAQWSLPRRLGPSLLPGWRCHACHGTADRAKDQGPTKDDHGWCGHTTSNCNDLKELIRKSKKKKQKGYAKAGKSYNKQELNAFFKKKLKKALKVGKNASRTQELRNFENMDLSDSEKASSDSSVSSSSSESS